MKKCEYVTNTCRLSVCRSHSCIVSKWLNSKYAIDAQKVIYPIVFTRATLSSCVRPTVTSRGSILTWSNVGSRKQRHTIALRLYSFFYTENHYKTHTGSPPTEAPNTGGVG